VKFQMKHAIVGLAIVLLPVFFTYFSDRRFIFFNLIWFVLSSLHENATRWIMNNFTGLNFAESFIKGLGAVLHMQLFINVMNVLSHCVD